MHFFRSDGSASLKEILTFYSFSIRVPILQFLSLKKWRIFLESIGLWERVTVFLLLLAVFLGLFFWAFSLFFALTESIPKVGGVYTEGIVGEPARINPVLSQATEADADLVRLVYGSLFSYDDAGKLRESLAERYELLDEGKKYVVKIRQNVKWHDGRNFSADDVVFTLRVIQDPAYKSPLRANWQGVDISREDESTVVFLLKKPYFDFLENLTVGILPKHIWEGVAPEKFALVDFNLNPIGTGPFRTEGFKKDSSGTILSYELRSFPSYFDGTPFLQKLLLYFYQSEDDMIAAYNRREILGMSNIAPEKLVSVSEKKVTEIRELEQPRVFALFLNEKKNVALADERVRRALSFATDREAILREVLGGRGSASYSLFSPNMIAYSAAGEAYGFRMDESKRILEEAGWKLNGEGVREKDGVRIEFEIVVPDWAELVKTAKMVENEWKEIGVRVSVRVPENVVETQRIIRSREYPALLYGLAMTFEPNPYSFWHSCQTGEFENNFAMFSDKRADELLSNAREMLDESARSEMYREFQGILAEKMPAVFLYSPRYLYVQNSDIRGFSVRAVNAPASRFQGISNWYMNTKRVWKKK